MTATPAPLLKAIAPDRAGLVVAVECLVPWSWRADLCALAGLAFVLGHALYMKAMHGGKAHRAGVAERFADPAGHKSLEVDLALLPSDDPLLAALELAILKAATHHDAYLRYLWPTVPGIGRA